jgi:xanthine/uracil permease
MTLEQLPLVLGGIIALLGLLVGYDAIKPMGIRPFRERRRRSRAKLDRTGELLIALGIIGMAVALLNRDTGRFGTLAVMIGAVLLLTGGLMNRTYLKEMLLFRGAARRADAGEKVENPNEADRKPDRIR